jgi:hypothetical protein
MPNQEPIAHQILSYRLAGALEALKACPGRYHTSILNQTKMIAEIGYTDGWTIDVPYAGHVFSFSHQFVNTNADDDEIWWGCHRGDACRCLIRANFLGTHRLILPPATLDLDQAEVYTRLRLDGMTPPESLDIALLI